MLSTSYPEAFSFPGVLVFPEVTQAAKLPNIESAVEPVKFSYIFIHILSFYTAEDFT